ncbi:hypothetical protein TI05_03630 [Achromatium sp. WMS3]|nr:hypothetical protein TI05_03630 [Achromatium sp. WMS3]
MNSKTLQTPKIPSQTLKNNILQRHHIKLDDIAAFDNLATAAWKAARGKRNRTEISTFFTNFDHNINKISNSIRLEQMPYGIFKTFYIRDPKVRLIHAACFEDRILHHAIMNYAAPILERAMSPAAYACLPEKGVHKAAYQVQKYIRRYPWYIKIDIQAYFNTIDHAILFKILRHRFKGTEFLALLNKIIDGYHFSLGKGLPIGSLTSQYFANYYLDKIDRLLLAHPTVMAAVRYMDDLIWWCQTKELAQLSLNWIRNIITEERLLTIKPKIQINRSLRGVTYCGYRILPGTLRLSTRRKRQYYIRRCYWEHLYVTGHITALQLQQAYASVHAITDGANSRKWRQKNLAIHPALDI